MLTSAKPSRSRLARPSTGFRSMRALAVAGVVALVCMAHSFDGLPPQTGTMEDMQHIVVLMQENRAFDHYCASSVAGTVGDCFHVCALDS